MQEEKATRREFLKGVSTPIVLSSGWFSDDDEEGFWASWFGDDEDGGDVTVYGGQSSEKGDVSPDGKGLYFAYDEDAWYKQTENDSGWKLSTIGGGTSSPWEVDAAGNLTPKDNEPISVDEGLIKDAQGFGIDVAEYSGATLAQRLENAVAANGSARYHIPYQNPDTGAAWDWDKSVTISTGNVDILGTKRSNIDYTLGSGSGPLLELTGSRQYVEGLSFQSAGTQTPDKGIYLNGSGEQEAVDCFIADASVGFEVNGWKCRVHGCRTNNTGSDGFLITGPNNAITRSFAKNAGQDGIRVNNGNAPSIHYCSSDSATRYALNIEGGCRGYAVTGLTVEGGQTGGTTTDALIRMAGNGSWGEISGGFILDQTSTRRGYRVEGGNHIINGNYNQLIDGETVELVSTSTGRLGVQNPVVHLNGFDPNQLSYIDNSNDALLYVDGAIANARNLSGKSGRFVNDVQLDDGTNTTGSGLPCRWTGSAWQPFDGSATFT